jgi:large subunit ribosomal protein L10
MNKVQKTDAIEVLKGKFSQYSNFYVTNTESLSVAQIGTLRRLCFDKNIEMKVAKNTLIRKALEGIDAEKYTGVYDALHGVTALMFSDNPKEPAVIIAGFRKDNPGDKPVLKAAMIGEDLFFGDNQLASLVAIKTKNELIGDVIGLLQSPAKRVIAALLNHVENGSTAPAAEEAAPVVEAAPAIEVVAEAAAPEVAPEAPAADAAPEAEAPAAE